MPEEQLNDKDFLFFSMVTTVHQPHRHNDFSRVLRYYSYETVMRINKLLETAGPVTKSSFFSFIQNNYSRLGTDNEFVKKAVELGCTLPR